MKKIELHCPCGASITLTDKRGTYINPGGAPDDLERVFLIDRQADQWHSFHADHQSAVATVHSLAFSPRDSVIVEYESGAMSPTDCQALEDWLRERGVSSVVLVVVRPGRGHLRFIKTSKQMERP